MSQLVAILKTVLPVLALLLIGHFARRWHILTQEGVDGIKSIVIKVMLPIVQFRAFLQVHFGLDMLLITFSVFLVCILGLFLGRLSGKVFRNSALYERYLFASFEVGMLGYALYIVLFGNAQVANFATVAFGQELYVFLVMVPALQIYDGKKPTAKEAALSIIKTPVLIGIFAGIIGSIAGLGRLLNSTAAGEVVYGVMEFASAPTAANSDRHRVRARFRGHRLAFYVARRIRPRDLPLACLLRAGDDPEAVSAALAPAGLGVCDLVPAPAVIYHPVLPLKKEEAVRKLSTFLAFDLYALDCGVLCHRRADKQVNA
ncbi:MAG: AEC family transporter [Eubacteriales bacterium]